jgi:HAD superfamily hydrolase (TIGR01490 family)
VSDAASPADDPDDHRAEAAFFDLDKTIIAKAAMAAFRGPLYDGGVLTKRAILRALFAQIVYFHLGASETRLTRLRGALLKVTRGWDRSQVREIVDETLERIVDPIIYAEAIELIEFHRDLGRLVVVVSASPEEIVVPLARHLGVSTTIASRAEVDGENRYTGEMAFYAYGPFKADAMRDLAATRALDLDRSFAYSDSFTDVPMLEVVGHPVAVNPDRVLANLARERGWEIRHFVRPVRLRVRVRVRDRVQAAPRRAITVSAGALAFGAAALALGWRLGRRGAAEFAI